MSKSLIGMRNPLYSHKLNFEYEVVKQGDVKMVEYEDYDGLHFYPECPIILKTLGGSFSSNQIYCNLGIFDAEKIFRPGDIVSAELNFSLSQKADGSYEQTITADNVYTLNDYYQMKEAEAQYKGSLDANKQKTA